MKCQAARGREIPDVICAARQFVLEARGLRAPLDVSEVPVACDGCAAGRAALYGFLTAGTQTTGEHEVTVDFSEDPEVLARFRKLAGNAREPLDVHLRWLVSVYVNH